MLVYAFVFSVVFRFQMESYMVYLVSSLLPYQFLTSCLTGATTSLVANSNIYKSHYVPKAIFPGIVVATALFDFLMAYGVLLTIGYFFGFRLSTTQLILPISCGIIVLFAMGCAMITAILGVYFKDMQYIVGVVMQIAFFLTPIVYPPTALDAKYRALFIFNPFYHLIRNFNLPLYYHEFPSFLSLGGSAFLAAVVFIFGAALFMKYESRVVFVL